MPTGWRPADVAEKYPVYKITDVYDFEKYDSKASMGLHIWSWAQLVMILLFISYLFGNIAVINGLDRGYIYAYGGFAFLSIYAYTELMDRNQYAIVWEIARGALGIWFIYQQGDWFGASSVLLPAIKYILTGYFIASIFVTAYFVIRHHREDQQQLSIA
jgi:alkylglycerol monooxygenase